jgi:hypothetical protein
MEKKQAENIRSCASAWVSSATITFYSNRVDELQLTFKIWTRNPALRDLQLASCDLGKRSTASTLLSFVCFLYATCEVLSTWWEAICSSRSKYESVAVWHRCMVNLNIEGWCWGSPNHRRGSHCWLPRSKLLSVSDAVNEQGKSC